MQPNNDLLPEPLRTARENYQALNYTGPPPDFGAAQASVEQARRRPGIWTIAACVSVIAIGGVLVSQRVTQPEWSPEPGFGTQLAQVPKATRPNLPTRPVMPQVPRRQTGFALEDDFG